MKYPFDGVAPNPKKIPLSECESSFAGRRPGFFARMRDPNMRIRDRFGLCPVNAS